LSEPMGLVESIRFDYTPDNEWTTTAEHKLAAEIERLTAALAEKERALKIATMKANASLANNLCPDHRDKQAGKPCLACEIEALQSHSSGASSVARGPSVGTDAAACQWIAVSERLPTHIHSVLIRVTKEGRSLSDLPYTDIGIYNDRRGKWQMNDGDGDDIDVEVSHWMPLPPAPGQDTTLQNASGPSERRKALEEAAKVCEKVSGLYEPYLDSAFDNGGFTAAVRCADLLRHLAQQGD
jgi:hypothetical protein